MASGTRSSSNWRFLPVNPRREVLDRSDHFVVIVVQAVNNSSGGSAVEQAAIERGRAVILEVLDPKGFAALEQCPYPRFMQHTPTIPTQQEGLHALAAARRPLKPRATGPWC